jgi:hypothetical protein
MVISDHAGSSEELVCRCEGAGRAPGRDAELAKDVLHVTGDRVLADDQARSDLAVAVPGRDEAQDFQLTLAEPVRLRR